ncbi:MAG: hypothetical protein R6V50_03160 [Thermoplasmatota archaeon]
MDLEQFRKIRYVLDIKKYTYKTVLSLLFIFTGIVFYIYWGIHFGVWADIGSYSITVLFVIGGILGLLLSVMEHPDEE